MNILTRSLLYVVMIAMVSLSVAALLYIAATHPVRPGADHDPIDKTMQGAD